MTEFTVEKGVLQYCRSDEETIRIPDNVKKIANFSFSRCRQVRHIYLHEKVHTIEKYVFNFFDELESIEVHPDNKKYFVQDGVLFTRNKTTKGEQIELTWYPACRKGCSYAVPENVIFIAPEAFEKTKYLKSLTIPDSLEYRPYDSSVITFSDCIEELIIPSCCTVRPHRLFRRKSVKIYPSKHNKTPRNFYKYYEEDGSVFVRTDLDIASINHARYHIYPVRYNKNKAGEAVLLSEVHAFDKEPFEGCEKLTAIIVPKYPITVHDRPELDFDLGRPIPLVMPRIDFKLAANEATKINLLLGYLAHPEFYNDNSWYVCGSYGSYVARYKAKLLPYIYLMDRPDLLKFYAERNYITKKNFQDVFLTPAIEANASRCIEFLTNWQKETAASKEQLCWEAGLHFEKTKVVKRETNKPAYTKRLLCCDKEKEGKVFLPFDVTEIAEDAFDGCDRITAIIAPNFEAEIFGYQFNKGATIPLVFPQINFKTVKNEVVKINLLLGYLAHPEYYEDAVTGRFQTNTLGEDYLDYVVPQRKKLLPYVFALDRSDMLEFYAIRKLIDKKNFEQLYMSPAKEANAEKCVAFLKKWETEYL